MKAQKKLESMVRLLQAIVAFKPDETFERDDSCYPTQIDLVKLTHMDREDLKKCLKQLGQWALVQPIGLNPKRYRFDEWKCQQLLEEQYGEGLDESLDKVLTLFVETQHP